MSSADDEPLAGNTEPTVVYAGDGDGLTADTIDSIITEAGDGILIKASPTDVLTIDDMFLDEDEFDMVIDG